ncbi:RNA-binding motif protein, X-linked 2 [Acyrthosiphon pisum]|uniref:RNA-binding motif protein, X-linked 2 n=1 Tax=Acyrthosiphon pisum TaxID=7029 RepID=A0A8R2AAV7_ACYPI|nr:RNA-binding motif protein, X-linked 2 [Acyrthosiphon pisum]|eukprot:XP_001949636.2 PREDICTED: RNA-binding motif protein, X-linked 2 [Acyrthosiphon pisum]
MNPLTNMRNVKKLSEQELQRLPKSSWHDEYKSSAWIFVGGLPYDLSEGDIMSIFSQYGEITNLNLVRDKDTGKQKGFCFVCYEDQRSTILAVDNFNGTRVLGRILRVDHVKDYKPPKNSEPTTKIKTEKLEDDFHVKTETNDEIILPQFQRTISTPEIKREVCTPEIKREVCTPEIIESPKYESSKKNKKSKDKKRHHSDQRERSREKYRKKHNKSEQDISSKREKSNKRQSQEKDVDKNSKTKSSKEHSRRDKSSERDRKKLKVNRKEYNNRDYDDKNKRKNYQKDDKNYKKTKKV